MKGLRAGGLLAAGALTGAILAGTIGANAATSSSTGSTATTGSTSSSSTAAPPAPHGTGARPCMPPGHHPNETVLTGTAAQKVKAAALEAVPGGTVNRVETDSGEATYEAHMTKADGTLVTVKLDKTFAVTAVEDGMGK